VIHQIALISCALLALVTRCLPLRQLKGLTSKDCRPAIDERSDQRSRAFADSQHVFSQPSDLFSPLLPGFVPINETTTKLPGAQSIHHSAGESLLSHSDLYFHRVITIIVIRLLCYSSPVDRRSPCRVYIQGQERESRRARRLQFQPLLFHYHLFSAPVSLVNDLRGGEEEDD
jgi:hypothetical protein